MNLIIQLMHAPCISKLVEYEYRFNACNARPTADRNSGALCQWTTLKFDCPEHDDSGRVCGVLGTQVSGVLTGLRSECSCHGMDLFVRYEGTFAVPANKLDRCCNYCDIRNTSRLCATSTLSTPQCSGLFPKINSHQCNY